MITQKQLTIAEQAYPYQNLSLEDMEGEIWRNTQFNYVSVSNVGRVKISGRYVNCMNGHKSFKKERIVKQTLTKRGKGYLYVSFNDGMKKDRKIFVHRLLAMTFIDNPHSKKEVNHINGNSRDNNVINLERVTRSENQQHAFDNGLQVGRKGSNHHMNKITEADALEIIRMRDSGMTYTKIAKVFNVCPNTPSRIYNGKNWTHINRNLIEAGEAISTDDLDINPYSV